MEYNTNNSNYFYSSQYTSILPCTSSLQSGQQFTMYTTIPLSTQVHYIQPIQYVQPVSTIISATNETISAVIQDQQEQLQQAEEQEEGDEEPDINYNSLKSLEHLEQWAKQRKLPKERKTRIRNDIRKSRQKVTRTNRMSFLSKLLSYVGYTFKFEQPKRDSLKTFCLVIQEIINPLGETIYRYEDALEAIGEYYKERQTKRSDIREGVMVVEVNVLLFLIEEEGAEIVYGQMKKVGFHMILSSENILSLTFDGIHYSPDDMMEIGEQYFNEQIKPLVQPVC